MPRSVTVVLHAAPSALNTTARRQLLEERLEPRYVFDSTVVFNEIMFHPQGDETKLEWIELHNQQAVDMDLSGWSLAGGIGYNFPNGTIVAGGARLVVAISPADLQAASGYAGGASVPLRAV